MMYNNKATFTYYIWNTVV